jgi:hypothetical protein
MDFEHSWNLLNREQQLTLETETGLRFTAAFSEGSIQIGPASGGRTRSISKGRFEKWFHMWFDEGRRSSNDFRNESGQESKAGNFSYAWAVFKHLENRGTANGRARLGQETDIAIVIDAWPTLPQAIKAGILAMIRTAIGGAG